MHFRSSAPFLIEFFLIELQELSFLQRRHTDGQKLMKRCSTSLIIREMQSKLQWWVSSTLVRMAIIKSLQVNAGEDVEKREPSYTVAGM